MSIRSQRKGLTFLPLAFLPSVAFLGCVLNLAILPELSAQIPLEVNSVDDADDGICDITHCSLREAIIAANNSPDGGIIAFQIPGPGPHTIQPTSPLPSLEDDVILDGTTEPDFSGSPVIELDGTLAGPANGFDIVGSNNVVRGLVINRFEWNGIQINTDCTHNVIEGNFIGTDLTGTLGVGNGNGVGIGGGQDNVVGGATHDARNLISGNIEGVTIVGASASGNVVAGNYIGTDVNGSSAIPNNEGVLLLAPGNTVGGIDAGAGNLISGNSGPGVGLGAPNATGNLILGNYIGVDASGTEALGNDIGVWVDNVADNTIGGASPGARNVISGNREGITLWEAGATGNTIQGNYVGTNATGDGAVGNEFGMAIYSPDNMIGGSGAGAGNLISGNQINGVNFYGENATGNQVQGNFIGTDLSGTIAVGNGESGVAIHAAKDNLVGGTESGAGNLIAGNAFGVLIGDLESTGNRVEGNLIGTNASGDGSVPNTEIGVLFWGEDNTIGGSAPGAGNVISGNTFAGIGLGEGSSGTVIQGNLIGTDAAGTAALGNDLGIFVTSSPDNTIGGTTNSSGNVISGNTGGSITITGPTAAGNRVQGNYIGPDITGTLDLSDGRGIQILDAPDNIIGGKESGAGNLISGNLNGIRLEGPNASGNIVQGNHFGVDATGTAPLGNRGATIRLSAGAANNTIGGAESGAGNIIANGGWVGIVLMGDAGTGNEILSNAIFDNGGLGIDLGRDAPTPNDEGDADTGPNDLQNYPTLTSVASSGGAVIQADLNSTPSSSFTLDFFSNTACDPAGYGEGQFPLGTASLTTDASGSGSVTRSFGSITGTILTATATDANGNTSEFSACGDLTTLGVSSSPVTRTVTPGQSAVYTITVSAQGGTFDETVGLSCSGAPSQATCTFTQDQITLVGGEASATMTVETAAPASSGPWTPRPGPRSPLGFLVILALFLVVWILSLNAQPTARRSAPGDRPGLLSPYVIRWSGVFVLGGLTVALLSSCGKDGTSPPTGGTPAGTYELTITAAWESAQTTAQATLVVQ